MQANGVADQPEVETLISGTRAGSDGVDSSRLAFRLLLTIPPCRASMLSPRPSKSYAFSSARPPTIVQLPGLDNALHSR